MANIVKDFKEKNKFCMFTSGGKREDLLLHCREQRVQSQVAALD